MDEAIVTNACLAMLWLLLLCITGLFRTYARRGPSVQDPRALGIESWFSVQSPWSQEIHFANKMRERQQQQQQLELSRRKTLDQNDRNPVI